MASGCLAVGACFPPTSSAASLADDLRAPVRVRLLRLPPISSTNSLFLSIHRTPRHVTFSAPRFDSYLGGAIVPAGDVDGDGFTDVLVSARRYSKRSLSRAGAALLLLGSSTGLVANVGWSFVGERANRQFGHALSAGQDVNGDGLPDMAISTVHRMNAGVNRGGLNLFYGSTNAISNSRNWQYLPEAHDGQLGDCMALADFNGDGFADLIAGASRHTKSLDKEGAAFLFLGGRSGLSDAPTWSAFGGATNSGFGDSLCAPGDVNGDGFTDALVGAPAHPVNGRPTGRVLLFTGGPTGLSSTPVWTADGFNANSQFGQSLSGIGDVNRDGCADFLVGAPCRSSLDSSPGAAFLFLGAKSSMSTNPAWTSSGEMSGARFGAAVAGVGDVNGDGLNDAVIGSPNLTLKTTEKGMEGRAYLYLGVKGGIESTPSWTVEGSDRFLVGQLIASLGDLDRDGFTDFALSLQERSRFDVFYGNSTGFNRGDIFPADGISAMDMRQKAAVPDVSTNSVLNPFAIEVPPGQTSRAITFLALALIPVLLGGTIILARQRQRTAINAERARIAKDLHDEIGSRLTQIGLLGERIQAGRHGGADAGDEAAGCLATQARELAGRMDEVVWTIAPDKSSLEELVTFLGQSGERYFAGGAIRYRQFLPVELPDVMLSSAVRKHLPLVIKEAFNNAAKHSGASEVHLRVLHLRGRLNVNVEDNGTGRAGGVQKPAGNGIQNMRSRVEEIGGTLSLHDRPEGGVTVSIEIPL